MAAARPKTGQTGGNRRPRARAQASRARRANRNALDDFEWEVDVEGYQIVARDHLIPIPGAVITDSHWIGAHRGIAEAVRRTRRYKLATFPLLFETFANTETTHAAVLAFANKYGFLGFLEPTFATEPMVDSDGRHSNWELESIEDWVTEIVRLRSTIEAWRMIRSRDTVGLRSRVRLDKARDVLLYVLPHDAGMDAFQFARIRTEEWPIAAADKEPMLLKNFKLADEPLLPARAYLRQAINDRLRRQVSAQVGWDADDVHLVLRATPTSLIGALWLQFAATVARKSTMHPCCTCGKWMEIGRTGSRSDRRYCSNSCRTTAARRRAKSC